jgi:ankyrin repeat protein
MDDDDNIQYAFSEHLKRLIDATMAALHAPFEQTDVRHARMTRLDHLLGIDATEINTLNVDLNDRETLLYIAMQRGDCGVASMLLDYGADPNIICSRIRIFQRNCLTGACSRGTHVSLPMVSLLINRGAIINAKMPGSNLTALHFACGSGSFECVGLLIENGADMTARDHDGNTPLWYTVKTDGRGLGMRNQSVVDTVQTLVTYGANIREINSRGQTLLHQAAGVRGGHINMRIVKYLVDGGVKDVRDMSGASASDIAWDAAGTAKYYLDIARLFHEGLQKMVADRDDRLNVLAQGYDFFNSPEYALHPRNRNRGGTNLYTIGRDPLKMIADYVRGD